VAHPYKQVGLEDAVSFRSLELLDWRWSADGADPHLNRLYSRVTEAIAGFERNSGIGVGAGALGPLVRMLIRPLMYRRQALPLFDDIRRTEPATAWVAYKDDIALLALHYLRDARVRLPQDLSLVGFGDTHTEMRQGLSSYNFNIPAVVNSMLDHVLAPRRAGARSPMVEIPGTVVERRTSGQAPR